MRLQPIFDIVEICARKGIEHAVVCPGSRSAPLTLAFARHRKIVTRTVSDERSAAFIALGIAQQTGRPVALVCTSGSAAYNFAPAIAEAFYQRIPLIVFTADRPAEWIGQWDGQTISQQGIYGPHVKRAYHLPGDYEHPDSVWAIQRIVNEAINLSTHGGEGPVHINVPLREPLYPTASESISFSDQVSIVERIPTSSDPTQWHRLSSELGSKGKILIVAGQGKLDTDLIEAVYQFSKTMGAVVVADVISNLHAVPTAVRHADTFLVALDTQAHEELAPDLLITFGRSVISKNLKLFLRKKKPAAHWHVDLIHDEVIDPFQSLTLQIDAEPIDWFTTMAKAASATQKRKDYVACWEQYDVTARQATQEFFKNSKGEFSFVYRTMRALPDHSALHLANSMTVRYANLSTLEVHQKGVAVFSNRGTSGIDGCTSTSVGHALSSKGLHVLITGDVAFLYDRNAFWNNYVTPNLRIIVLNNHGGAIFSMIDGPGSLPEVGEYFTTHQPQGARAVAEEFGLIYQNVESSSDLDAILADFFKASDRAKILEFESSSHDAKEIFLKFKDHIKRSYAT